MGPKLLLTPSGDPAEPLKADRGWRDTISKNANPASTFEISQCRHCKGRLPGPRRRLLGALRQSVPQNGRVHLHVIDLCLCVCVRDGKAGRTNDVTAPERCIKGDNLNCWAALLLMRTKTSLTLSCPLGCPRPHHVMPQRTCLQVVIYSASWQGIDWPKRLPF